MLAWAITLALPLFIFVYLFNMCATFGFFAIITVTSSLAFFGARSGVAGRLPAVGPRPLGVPIGEWIAAGLASPLFALGIHECAVGGGKTFWYAIFGLLVPAGLAFDIWKAHHKSNAS